MHVQIGAKTPRFSDPTALLSDCHRRIEMFLGSLQRVAQIIDSPLSADARSALETAPTFTRQLPSTLKTRKNLCFHGSG